MTSRQLVHFFLSWWGLWLLAALDATVIFTFPIALDAVVVVMSSVHRNLFWLVALVALTGSLLGAFSSIKVGEIVGEQGLTRVVPGASLDRVKRHLGGRRSRALALAPLMPPPFPLTAVLVAAGALKIGRVRVLSALAIGFAIRFTLESVLALWYGRRIVRWINSAVAWDIGVALIAIAVVASIASIVRLVFWRPRQPAESATRP